jgi:hypothetical protein
VSLIIHRVFVNEKPPKHAFLEVTQTLKLRQKELKICSGNTKLFISIAWNLL